MYYDDKPIFSSEEDLLHRGNFSKTLAKSILNLQNDTTFTIGLYGQWGCGKTSIVNMLESEIESLQSCTEEINKLILVHFEPWNFLSCDQLLSQFFVRLASEFKKISKKFGRKESALKQIGEALETYSELFSLVEAIPVFGKALSSILQNGTKVVGGNFQKRGADISTQKQKIIDMLNSSEQNHKFLIIIDDVDRLSNDQIRQVFQLIASVANFPKVRYLVVFDKGIVVKALEKVQDGSGEAYLEKIIQMPIEVPKISTTQLSNIMIQNLSSIYETYYHSSFDYMMWRRSYTTCCEPFIESIRDINRICNTLSVKLSAIASEVDFMDMTAITTIQILFPPIYEWIKRDRSCPVDRIIKKIYNEPVISKEKMTGWLKDLGYSEDDYDIITENITSCLAYLFPSWGIKEGASCYETYNKIDAIKNNNISNPYKFERYFSLDLNSVAIKQSDIIKIKSELSLEEIKNAFVKHYGNGTIIELMDEIMAIRSDFSKERAKIIMLAVLDSFYIICLGDDSEGVYVFQQFLFLSYKMIDAIPRNERFEFLNSIVGGDDFKRVISFIPAMRYIEMDYERLEKGYKEDSVITESELDKIELTLYNRVNLYLENQNLYDVPNWVMIVNLLEKINPDFFREYFIQSFNVPSNILKFLRYSTDVYNNLAEYMVQNDYEKYLTKEQILNTMMEMRCDKSFYKLPQEVQNISVAFYRNDQRLYKYGNITLKGIKETLDTWKNEDNIE
ncbi:MAG: hypothetical protein HDT43_09590 [Ruminococcaceae bacterium]|nr:hypothetical protein [Oscillospiraceae bacterium]